MTTTLLEKLQELVEFEVQRQLMKYAQIISKKHDISLKLLLQDIPGPGTGAGGDAEEPKKTGQCLGVTANRAQCKSSGKHGGYCARHVHQMKKKDPVAVAVPEPQGNPHIGHTMKQCMFLAGCPACEKTRVPPPNLLIDI